MKIFETIKELGIVASTYYANSEIEKIKKELKTLKQINVFVIIVLLINIFVGAYNTNLKTNLLEYKGNTENSKIKVIVVTNDYYFAGRIGTIKENKPIFYSIEKVYYYYHKKYQLTIKAEQKVELYKKIAKKYIEGTELNYLKLPNGFPLDMGKIEKLFLDNVKTYL